MPPSPYVSRVNQLDAAQLDAEIYKVLRAQVQEITKHGPLGRADQFQAEIDALLKCLVWVFSLRRGNSTFGQQLLNLHYANIDGTKSALYLLLTTLPAYFSAKIAGRRIPTERTGGLDVKSILDRAANLVKLLEFLNILAFLHRGKQPRLLERLLGISSSSRTTHQPRTIGYSYMTRELLWHGLMELFTIGLPMINFHYLKQTAKGFFLRRKGLELRRSFPAMSTSTKCAYCADAPILPTHAGCEHIFCYYCLKAHFMAMDEFHCPECRTELRVEDMRNYEEVNLDPPEQGRI